MGRKVAYLGLIVYLLTAIFIRYFYVSFMVQTIYDDVIEIVSKYMLYESTDEPFTIKFLTGTIESQTDDLFQIYTTDGHDEYLNNSLYSNITTQYNQESGIYSITTLRDYGTKETDYDLDMFDQARSISKFAEVRITYVTLLEYFNTDITKSRGFADNSTLKTYDYIYVKPTGETLRIQIARDESYIKIETGNIVYMYTAEFAKNEILTL